MINYNAHERGPRREDRIPEDVRRKLEALASSEYMAYARPLKDFVACRTVLGSSAGHSGFTVELDDGTYLLAYLDQDQLGWKRGVGRPSPAELELMSSPAYGDGMQPLAEDRIYASEPCDIAAEVRKAHGQTIQTISIGVDTFNLAFLDGHELDAMIVTGRDGRRALRVFWEQW
jgi:hypothetical protein